ncbi:MAG: EscU/YscU/HrcU family type III secretion system export apparatus switch protein [Pseudomonadota bacterium]
MSDQSEAKTDPASRRKLRKQREQGSIANGQEMASLAACAFGLLLLAATGMLVWKRLASSILETTHLDIVSFDAAMESGLLHLAETLFLVLAPIIGVTFATGFIATILFNGGFVFALKPVTPQLNRVSPKTGLSRIFGRRGWLEAGVSFVRLAIWLLLAGFIGYLWLPHFLASPACAGACAANIAVPLTWIIVVAAMVVILLSGVIEAVIQKNQFLHEQKMTKTEVKRERKDQFGSPEVVRERRRLMREAQRQGAAPGAKNGNLCFFSDDFAVAIRYLPPEEKFPYVVAKAVGADAVRHLRKAMQGGGQRQAEASDFVRGLTGVDIGSALEPKHYDQFVAALRKTYD